MTVTRTRTGTTARFPDGVVVQITRWFFTSRRAIRAALIAAPAGTATL